MRKFVAFLAFAVLLIGCTQEPVPVLEKETLATRSYLISMDSLRKIALDLPFSLSEETTTRALSKQVAEIVPVAKILSSVRQAKTAKSYTPVYVVNYEDDAGFAILSADSRTDQILAYSDYGNLTEEEDNPGVLFFLEGIPAFMEDQIANYSATVDSLFEDYYCESWNTGTNTFVTIRGPYTTTQWNQNPDPYYTYMPTLSCSGTSKKAYAGCVTIALLQIIAYYNKPVSFKYGGQNYSINYWPDYTYTPSAANLAPSQREILGKYIYYMTERAQLNATYACSGTSVSITDGRTHLKSVGLQIGSTTAYSWTPIKQDIDNYRIVWARGNSSDSGHSWVIDGYRIYTTQHTWVERCYDRNSGAFISENTGSHNQYQNLVRCNWGWGGYRDGYFNSGVFNTNYPPVDPTRSGEPGYYDRNIQMINNIR